MKLLSKIVVVSLIGLQAFSAFASAERDEKIKAIFNDIKKISKGALDQNAYQGPLRRSLVMQNGVITGPAKDNLITVAFRNAKAKELAALDFYVGNRYASNYWELNNAYLATPEEQLAVAFRFSPVELKAKADGLPMAISMAKHQMLELYYMAHSPTSNLTKGYNYRGVSDADHELKYYRLYADYLASNIKYDNDYLTLLEFQKSSGQLPGKKTISLSGIRLLVANISTKFDTYLDPALASQFRSLRNSIHNGMNRSVIKALSDFQATNAAIILPEDVESYESLKSQISAYYKIDKEIISILLPSIKADMPDAATVLASITLSGNSAAALLKLSELAVGARQKFYVTKNIDLTHLIIRIQEFLSAEFGSLNLTSKADLAIKAKALVNMSYASGLMTQAKRNELVTLLDSNIDASISLLSQALTEGVTTYEKAFQPALADWKLVSTSVSSFVDDGIRSSTLIGLDSTLTQLKKLAPAAPKPVAPTPGQVAPDASITIENDGVGCGTLILIPKLETEKLVPTLSGKMIPIFESLPLDLGVVAGVITEEAQTPLSHVNIKSKNRGTPNVFIPNAAKDSRIKDFLAKKVLVRLELAKGAMSIRQITAEEAKKCWENTRPVIRLRADLAERRIRSTENLGFKDVISIGAKAANYSEGTHVLPKAFRPGFAIPFYYYREFIRTNTIDGKTSIEQYITQLISNPKIQSDKAFLAESLKKLQERMTDPSMIVNKDLIIQLKTLVTSKYPNQKIRFRSSTNSEDMPMFTGAGLYDSGAYDPAKPKKTIEKALQYVWASVWNLRAFEERELFKINHLDVSMAMLVSPAYPNEIANGVGVSRNILKPELGEGFYLNIQSGSDAVTNPDATITPDQVIVLKKRDPKTGTKYTLVYTKYSSKTANKPVLEYKEVEKIADYLQTLQDHFVKLYHPYNDNPKFALDVEFKVDDLTAGSGNKVTPEVYYKQARPFVGQ